MQSRCRKQRMNSRSVQGNSKLWFSMARINGISRRIIHRKLTCVRVVMCRHSKKAFDRPVPHNRNKQPATTHRWHNISEDASARLSAWVAIVYSTWQLMFWHSAHSKRTNGSLASFGISMREVWICPQIEQTTSPSHHLYPSSASINQIPFHVTNSLNELLATSSIVLGLL